MFLQEVLGRHDGHAKKFRDWPTHSQTEFLAEGMWPHYTYGKNAVYTLGHHGNAVLSKYKIEFSENLDISKNKMESRGFLHAVLEVPHLPKSLHAISTHLGLFEGDRAMQAKDLCQRIRSMVQAEDPVILGGDFNDWRQRLTPEFSKEVGLEEAFFCLHQKHAKTFPAWMPVLCLDRIYFRGLKIHRVERFTEGPWAKLSDHAAIYVEFQI